MSSSVKLSGFQGRSVDFKATARGRAAEQCSTLCYGDQSEYRTWLTPMEGTNT